MIRYYISKIFQIYGIFLVGEGLYFGLVKHSMGKEMKLLAVGVLIFFIGWIIQRSAK
ncbi:MAG: hypothetical protein ACUZ77_02075 [Candidatus Brocadiales bacterium]